jgi:hypothetical protein
MSICDVCLNQKSGTSIVTNEIFIHSDLAALKVAASGGCSLCACLKNGIDLMESPYDSTIPESHIEFYMNVKPGKSLKVILRYEAQASVGHEYELEFYTMPGK